MVKHTNYIQTKICGEEFQVLIEIERLCKGEYMLIVSTGGQPISFNQNSKAFFDSILPQRYPALKSYASENYKSLVFKTLKECKTAMKMCLDTLISSEFYDIDEDYRYMLEMGTRPKAVGIQNSYILIKGTKND